MLYSNDTLKKQIYRTEILRYLLDSGEPLSQLDICKHFKLPKGTVSVVVNKAIDDGFIKRIGPSSEFRQIPGSKPVLIELDKDNIYSLGVVLRRKTLFIGLVNLAGEVSFFNTLQCDTFDFDSLVKHIKNEVNKHTSSNLNILGVGVAIGGLFKNYPEDSFYSGPYRDYHLMKKISSELNLPVIADDYPNAAAFAEHFWGKTQGIDNFVYFQVLHGALCVSCYMDGSILRGRNGAAGEIAFLKKSESAKYVHLQHLYDYNAFSSGKPDKVKENAFYLGHMILQIITFYDPAYIIMDGLPVKYSREILAILNDMIRNSFDIEPYGYDYKLDLATDWKNKEIMYGGSLVFHDFFNRPKIITQESVMKISSK